MARTAVRGRPGGCRWVLRVPAWPLGAAVQNFIEKAAGSRVAPGLVGVGLAASGSAVGQEQGVAGTPSVQLGKGPCSRPSRRPHRGQRQLRALALLQVGSCPLVPPRPALFGKKEGPSSGLSGPAPKPPPRPSVLFPRWPAAPGLLGTPSPVPRARPSAAAPRPVSWVCSVFVIGARPCASSWDPRHKPLRQKP